jgi:hypothetical protein
MKAAVVSQQQQQQQQQLQAKLSMPLIDGNESNTTSNLTQQSIESTSSCMLDENSNMLGNKALSITKLKTSLDDMANNTLSLGVSISGSGASAGSLVGLSTSGTSTTSTQNNLPEDIAIMEIILRFLQLLCENHNSDLQNYLRVQPNNKTSYNLVCETLQFLDVICGSTTGGLGLLGLWINENNVHLINQTLESLTEYCQGPCHDNQYAIINHESNGIDIVIALILNDIQPLSKNNLEMFLALKDNASKLLLAVMESNDDTANAERILYNITPKALIDVIREAYEQGKEMDRQAELVKQGGMNRRSSSMMSDDAGGGISGISGSGGESCENISNQQQSAPNTVEATTASMHDSSHGEQHSSNNETVTTGNLLDDSASPATNASALHKQQSITSQSSHASVKEEQQAIAVVEGPDTENGDGEDSEGASPREVGHNLYILAHKLAKFNKELSVLLKSRDSQENEALAYYAAHTAQIEIIREDRAMEQIVFPVPTICEYLTKETKQRIFLTTEKDEQNSKVTGFFTQVDSMWNEMKWQRKLRQQTWLYWISSHMSLWSDISFNFAVLINLLVAIFYPFDKGIKGSFCILYFIKI